MIQINEGGTVIVHRLGSTLVLQENPIISLPSRIGGALGGAAFMSVAVLFWSMEIQNADTSTPWLRAFLCTGLALIGIVLARGALIPAKSVEEIALDGAARELRVSKLTPDGQSRLRHKLKFADIKRFYAGSQTSTSVNRGGSTILYTEAEGGPRNGVLMAGSVMELEGLAPELNKFLKGPPVAGPEKVDTQTGAPAKRAGFGRKGQ